jgi:hypothetical protein
MDITIRPRIQNGPMFKKAVKFLINVLETLGNVARSRKCTNRHASSISRPGQTRH